MLIKIPLGDLFSDWKAWAKVLAKELLSVGEEIVSFSAGDLRTTLAQVYDTQQWLLADGTTLKISDFPSLYRMIGDTFNLGGEAADEFSLPDLTPFPTDQLILVKT